MLDSSHTDRPARRTALIAQKSSRYNVDIVALSETRLPGKGSLTEDQSGYTTGKVIEARRLEFTALASL